MAKRELFLSPTNWKFDADFNRCGCGYADDDDDDDDDDDVMMMTMMMMIIIFILKH